MDAFETVEQANAALEQYGMAIVYDSDGYHEKMSLDCFDNLNDAVQYALEYGYAIGVIKS